MNPRLSALARVPMRGIAVGAGPAAPFELLLLLARVQLDARHRVRLSALLAHDLDWDELLALAQRHRTKPLLAHHLAAGPAEVPEPVRRRLARHARRNAHRMLALVRDLVTVRDALADEGIAAVPYKGPVLGAQVYGSAALRPAGDLDLLIDRGEVERARRVLLAIGYRPRHVLGVGGVAFMVRSRYSETFVHPTAAVVELHWAFTNRDIALMLGVEELRPNLVRVQIGGVDFPGFGREDLLLTLAVHGCKHRWDRLEWLCGLGEALRGAEAEAVDWDRLVARGNRLGVRRMLLLGLLLAHELVEAPVPERVLRLAWRDAAVVGAAQQVPKVLMEPPVEDGAVSIPVDRFRYGLRERWRDRARFILYRLTTPSQPEQWTAIPVGSRVVPVHGFLRPFRLLLRGIAALRARLGGRT